MSVLHLAEFQVRLLLCSPKEKQGNSLRWTCGCVASAIGNRKYAVTPCAEHDRLLREVQENEEPVYDFLSAPYLRYPSGQSV